jgi:hypothetical protein
MESPLRVRILDENMPSSREQLILPDTGETGETYEIEFDEGRADPSDDQAIENAREFLSEQREQAKQALSKKQR